MGALFILLSASIAALAQPDPQTPVFRAGVAVVRVDAQVVDGRRVLSGLSREDFRVFDGGVPQEITYFMRDAEPLWLVLLLDVSGSMKRRLEEMAAVSRSALAALGPGDHLAVLFFGRDVKLASGFSTDTESAARAIAGASRERSVGSGTAINGALIHAAEYIRERADPAVGRRAILILTDNSGLNYQQPDEDALRALYQANAVVNAILTPEAREPAPPPPGVTLNPDFTPSNVFHLARETGGEALRARRAGETFREILERIRLRYSIHYRLPQENAAPGSIRAIRLDLSPDARRRFPKAELRARSGYLVPE